MIKLFEHKIIKERLRSLNPNSIKVPISKFANADEFNETFENKYFPIVNPDKIYKVGTKYFWYDADRALLHLIYKDEDELLLKGQQDTPWRSLDAVGLSRESWANDKESYLGNYADDLDEEIAYESIYESKDNSSVERLSTKWRRKLESEKYWDLVDSVFAEYEKKRDTISKGWITKETYDWLLDQFDLVSKPPEEVDLLWRTIDAYFHDLMYDEANDKWRNDVDVDEFMFWSDTDSAWKEALNNFSRTRRGEYNAFEENNKRSLRQRTYIKEGINKEDYYRKVYKIAEELVQYINDNGVWSAEIYEVDTPTPPLGEIKLEIDGDWKHDHLYSQTLAEEFFNEKGIIFNFLGEDVLEHTGDDSYPAVHTYMIILNEGIGKNYD